MGKHSAQLSQCADPLKRVALVKPMPPERRGRVANSRTASAHAIQQQTRALQIFHQRDLSQKPLLVSRDFLEVTGHKVVVAQWNAQHLDALLVCGQPTTLWLWGSQLVQSAPSCRMPQDAFRTCSKSPFCRCGCECTRKPSGLPPGCEDLPNSHRTGDNVNVIQKGKESLTILQLSLNCLDSLQLPQTKQKRHHGLLAFFALWHHMHVALIVRPQAL